MFILTIAKAIVNFIMVFTLLFTGTVASTQTHEPVTKDSVRTFAQDELHKKYGETFSADDVTKKTMKNEKHSTVFIIKMVKEGEPEIMFDAIVPKNGNYIIDNYERAIYGKDVASDTEILLMGANGFSLDELDAKYKFTLNKSENFDQYKSNGNVTLFCTLSAKDSEDATLKSIYSWVQTMHQMGYDYKAKIKTPNAEVTIRKKDSPQGYEWKDFKALFVNLQ